MLKPWKQMCEHICPDYSFQTYPVASRVIRNTIDAHPIQNKMTCLHGSEINTTFSHKEPLSGFGKNVKDALDLFSSTDNINSEIEPKLATWNESLRANNESLLYSGTIENVVSRHFPNLHKQVSIDIRWFVGNYASTYRDERSGKITPGRYANSPKDNQSVLDKFANYLHNKQESSQAWLRKNILQCACGTNFKSPFILNMAIDKVYIQNDEGSMIEAIAPVIISASRSTDIPAFFANWFFNRLVKGYCSWINPFNQQKRYISFSHCKVIVFWTKNPAPIIPYLHILDEMGIHYYFQFTLNDYTNENLEPNIPSLEYRIETFKNFQIS